MIVLEKLWNFLWRHLWHGREAQGDDPFFNLTSSEPRTANKPNHTKMKISEPEPVLDAKFLQDAAPASAEKGIARTRLAAPEVGKPPKMAP